MSAEYDNMGRDEVRSVRRWINAFDRQTDIAIDPEIPDEVREESANIAGRALWNAIASLPLQVRINASKWATDSGVIDTATGINE